MGAYSCCSHHMEHTVQLTTTDYLGMPITLRVMRTSRGTAKSYRYKNVNCRWQHVVDLQRCDKTVEQAMQEMVRFVQTKPGG